VKAGLKRTAKELWHILHDPRSLVIIFMLPVIQLVMFGYALNFEIQNVDIAIINYDNSHFSTELIDEFIGSRFFTVFFPDILDILPQDADQLFLERKARAVLIIPSDFGRQLERRKDVALQLLIDSADPNAAQHIRNYVTTVVRQYNTNHNRMVRLPFDVRSTIWFNPELKSAYFFVPGILALILVMISALLTSVAVAREKETGTLEQLLVSPVNQYEIVIGKVLPYIGLAFLDPGEYGGFTFHNPAVHYYSPKFGDHDFHYCPHSAGGHDDGAVLYPVANPVPVWIYFPAGKLAKSTAIH